MRKKLTLEIVGREDGDIEFALDEVVRLVRKGYRNGYNTDSGMTSLRFSIDDWPLGSERKLVEKKVRG